MQQPHLGGIDLSLARACRRFVYSPTYYIPEVVVVAYKMSSVTMTPANQPNP